MRQRHLFLLTFLLLLSYLLSAQVAATIPNSVNLSDKKAMAKKLNLIFQDEQGNEDSPTKCVSCTLVIALMENYIKFREKDIEQGVKKFCDLIDDPKVKTACNLFVLLYGDKVIEGFLAKDNPDVICRSISFCHNAQCNLYSKSVVPTYNGPIPNFKTPLPKQQRVDQSPKKPTKKFTDIWHDLFEKFYKVFNDHIPLYDFDGDGFATTFGFRGTAWRGKDCNDNDKNVYPGRKVNSYTPNVDHNCNGIVGINPQTGKSYEEELCDNTDQRGIIVIGDSASAHFRLPEQWFLPQFMNSSTYKPILEVAEIEVDWPHLSAYTGYTNDTTKLAPGPVDSLYLRMLQRNRCNHRDYENISVNGARSGAMKEIVRTMSRRQSTDHPVTLFVNLVGNDVCTPHPWRFVDPQEFHDNIVNVTDYLDTVLPPNSNVVFIGLADGDMLFPILHNITHPLGMPYSNLYDYLNCLGISPCWGWLNTNATARDATTAAAVALSAQYQQIIKEKQYKNFNMYFHDFPMFEIFLRYHVDYLKLIEPMDGFHPSRFAQPYMAQVLYEDLMEKYPQIFGSVNPNNDKIQQLFGNQGGY